MSSDTCLDDATTTQLLLGTLPDEVAEATEQHLLSCDSCLHKAQTLSADDDLTSALRLNGDDNPELDSKLDDLVVDLEDLGTTAQMVASAADEINLILKPDRTASGNPSTDDELGRLLHFRILEVIGAGGMGIVFKAEDGQLNRIVAIKVMRPSLASDPEAKLRFQREAKAVAAFEHERVVTVYQVDEDNGIPFFSMQWLEGESLRERLRRGKLPLSDALRVTREIADGLAAAHARGLLHRDIKPDNVWLQSPDDRVKILDFGLVRSVEERSSLTHSGTILGTPEYMSPEQACGEDVDERCDLFSVGCVFYQMLTGQPPFQAKNVVATLVAISNAKVEPPHTIDSTIPLSTSSLTAKLLHREPGRRVESAKKLSQEISNLEQSMLPLQSKASNVNSRWWRWIAIAAGAAMILAAVITVQTNNGTLYIETAEGVATKIVGESVELLDSVTKKKYSLSVGPNKLRPGDYEIVIQTDEGLEFSSQEFTIRRGGRKDILVRLAPPPESQAVTNDTTTKANTPLAKLDATVPDWHHGITEAIGIAPGDALSKLSLVQEPGSGEFSSWTRETKQHRGGVNDVCVYADLIASAGQDGTVRIWRDGELLNVLVCPGAEVGAERVAWSADGGMLAAASDKSISIWDVATIRSAGQPVKFLRQLRRDANQIAWAPTTNMLLFSDVDGVHLWDVEAGKLLPNRGMSGQISANPWSADGRLLGCLEKDGVTVWDVETKQPLATIEIDGDEHVRALPPVFYGDRYFTFAVNHFVPSRNNRGVDFRHAEIVIYDAKSAERVKSLRHTEQVSDVSWGLNGDKLSFLGDTMNSIELNTNDQKTLTLPVIAPIHGKFNKKCSWHKRDGSSVLCVLKAGQVWTHDGSKWSNLGVASSAREISSSVGGTRLAVRCFFPDAKSPKEKLNSTLEVWHMTSLDKLMSLDGDSVSWFSLSPNGETLATLSGNHRGVAQDQLRLYDAGSGGLLAETKLPKPQPGLAWLPSSDKICTAHSMDYRVYDGRSGEELLSFKSSPAFGSQRAAGNANGWSLDGKNFFRSPIRNEWSEGAAGYIVDATTGKQTRRFLAWPSEDPLAKEEDRIKEQLVELTGNKRTQASTVKRLQVLVKSLARQLNVAPDFTNEILPASLSSLLERIQEAKFEIDDLEASIQAIDQCAELETLFSPALLALEIDALPEVQRLRKRLDKARIQLAKIEAVAAKGKESPVYINTAKTIENLTKELQELRTAVKNDVVAKLRLLDRREQTKILESRTLELTQKRVLLKTLTERFQTEKSKTFDDGNSRLEYEFATQELGRALKLLLNISERESNLRSDLKRIEQKRDIQKRLKSRNRLTATASAWSPDRQRLAVIAGPMPRGKTKLYFWDLDNEAQEIPVLEVALERQGFANWSPQSLSYSPNGKYIAISGSKKLMIVDTLAGEAIYVSDERRRYLSAIGWVDDKTFLVCTSYRKSYSVLRIASSDGQFDTHVATETFDADVALIDQGTIFIQEANQLRRLDANLGLEHTFVFEHHAAETRVRRIALDGTELLSDGATESRITVLNSNNEFEMKVEN